MNITVYSAKYTHSTAGTAHASVSLGHVPHVGSMHIASLAFEHARNPAMLESPIYHSTFAPTADGKRSAIKAVQSAARRNELKHA